MKSYPSIVGIIIKPLHLKVNIDGKRRYQKVGIRDKGPKIKAICRDVFFFHVLFQPLYLGGGSKDFWNFHPKIPREKKSNLTNAHIFQVVQAPTSYPFSFWGGHRTWCKSMVNLERFPFFLCALFGLASHIYIYIYTHIYIYFDHCFFL